MELKTNNANKNNKSLMELPKSYIGKETKKNKT